MFRFCLILIQVKFCLENVIIFLTCLPGIGKGARYLVSIMQTILIVFLTGAAILNALVPKGPQGNKTVLVPKTNDECQKLKNK